VTDSAHSISELHKRWVELENEHHQLACTMREAELGGADLALLRDRQARLLLEINALVARIREAPASTLEDYLALLDVALEHEIDLAADIAFYGPEDYPMISRLLFALAEQVPGFEFNSLRRWLSLRGPVARATAGDADNGGGGGAGYPQSPEKSFAGQNRRQPRSRSG
jgi:hypothetical protein